MAERTQKSKNTSSRDTETTQDAAPAVTETGDKLKAELDDLLDRGVSVGS